MTWAAPGKQPQSRGYEDDPQHRVNDKPQDSRDHHDQYCNKDVEKHAPLLPTVTGGKQGG